MNKKISTVEWNTDNSLIVIFDDNSNVTIQNVKFSNYLILEKNYTLLNNVYLRNM